MEILLVTEGTVDYTVEDKVFQVRKGEILIIPPDTIHSLAMGEHSSRYIFLFEADTVMGMRDVKAMDKYFRRPFHLRDGGDAFIRIREMLIKMNEAYQKQELLWNTVCCSYLLRIYSLLAQWYIPGISRAAGGEVHSMRSEVFSSPYYEAGRNTSFSNPLTRRSVRPTGRTSMYYSPGTEHSGINPAIWTCRPNGWASSS